MDADEAPRVPIWRLVLLSAAGGAVNIGYAAEEGYAIPLIRAAGIPLQFTTLSLAFSPILGLLFQPFLGALSDQCKCWWGRRKPFILCLCTMAIVGCAAPYAFFLDDLKQSFSHILVKVFVIAFIVLLDFSIGSLQLPCRAFLLDVVPVSQSQTGNFIFSVTIAVDSALGFSLGAVDWSVIAGEGFGIQYQAQIVFGLAAIFLFLSMLSTLFSIKENPNQNKSQYFEDNKNVKENISYKPATTNTDDSNVLIDERRPLVLHAEKHDDASSTNSASCCMNIGLFKIFRDCITDIVSFVYYMSYHMWIVWLATFFGFLGEFSFVFGFTTFVGTIIYKGDPDADSSSEEYDLYAKGVRMGSLALALSSIVGAILSLSLDYVTKWVRLKTVFLVSLASFVVSAFLIILLQKIYFTMVFVLSYGPLLVTLLIVPYAVIPIYEKEGLIFRRAWKNAPDVIEGKACSVINTALFLGQIGASFMVGPIVDVAGSNVYFIVIPCTAVSISFFISAFIKSK